MESVFCFLDFFLIEEMWSYGKHEGTVGGFSKERTQQWWIKGLPNRANILIVLSTLEQDERKRITSLLSPFIVKPITLIL